METDKLRPPGKSGPRPAPRAPPLQAVTPSMHWKSWPDIDNEEENHLIHMLFVVFFLVLFPVFSYSATLLLSTIPATRYCYSHKSI